MEGGVKNKWYLILTRFNKILTAIRDLAKELFVDSKVSVYLYGSRARGEAVNSSDWDLLIVADDGLDTENAFEKYAYPFTEIGWKLGEQITPLFYTRSEWDAEQNTAFYINVQNDAILL